MVGSRRARVLGLAVFTVFVLTFVFLLSGPRESTDVLVEESDESKVKAGIEEQEIKKTDAGKSGQTKDLTNDPGQPFDPAKEYNAILQMAPVVVFSKSFCPHSKFVKDTLASEYQITPSPVIVELDKHPHGQELQQYIGAQSGRMTVPNVFISGISRGGGDEIRELHNKGDLAVIFQQWGGNKLRVKKLNAPSIS